MGKGIDPDDRLVGLYGEPGDPAHQPGAGYDLGGIQAGVAGKNVLARPDAHHDLFQRRIAGAFTQTVDGAFHLARAVEYCGERVADRQTQVVVTVYREDRLVRIGHPFDQGPDEFTELGSDEYFSVGTDRYVDRTQTVGVSGVFSGSSEVSVGYAPSSVATEYFDGTSDVTVHAISGFDATGLAGAFFNIQEPGPLDVWVGLVTPANIAFEKFSLASDILPNLKIDRSLTGQILVRFSISSEYSTTSINTVSPTSNLYVVFSGGAVVDRSPQVGVSCSFVAGADIEADVPRNYLPDIDGLSVSFTSDYEGLVSVGRVDVVGDISCRFMSASTIYLDVDAPAIAISFSSTSDYSKGTGGTSGAVSAQISGDMAIAFSTGDGTVTAQIGTIELDGNVAEKFGVQADIAIGIPVHSDIYFDGSSDIDRSPETIVYEFFSIASEKSLNLKKPELEGVVSCRFSSSSDVYCDRVYDTSNATDYFSISSEVESPSTLQTIIIDGNGLFLASLAHERHGFFSADYPPVEYFVPASTYSYEYIEPEAPTPYDTTWHCKGIPTDTSTTEGRPSDTDTVESIPSTTYTVEDKPSNTQTVEGKPTTTITTEDKKTGN